MCNPLIQFEIVNPVSSKKKPRYEKERNLFVFPVDKSYRYYIEARKLDEATGEYKWYLLLGVTKFSEHCRLCEVNMYRSCKIHPRGEFKDFIARECLERGNIDMDKVDANDTYDVWLIS